MSYIFKFVQAFRSYGGIKKLTQMNSENIYTLMWQSGKNNYC